MRNLKFDNRFEGYRFVEDYKDVSYLNVKRITAKIAISRGYSKEEVEKTLKNVAMQVYGETKAKAISIFAYIEGEDYKGAYTVGEITYAPGGKWENADKNLPLKYHISLGTAYFNEVKKSNYSAGDQILLVSDEGHISLSKTYDDWSDENELTKIKSGTKAVFLEEKIENIADSYTLIRYKVKVKNLIGWVFKT